MPQKLFFWIFGALLAFASTTVSSAAAEAMLRAFPTAEGYGAFAAGGRGGIIKQVTNLNDDGPGSLRDAVRGKTPRTVVFRVGGTINLNKPLSISQPYLTIAGQTAPGGGICIKGASLLIRNTHDVVIRHFCSRPGNEPNGRVNGFDNRDGIRIEHARNVIIDSTSVAWSTDELVTPWFPDTSDITIQNSILAEPLWNAGHSKGSHPMGPLVGPGVQRVSFIGNLFAHNGFRSPEWGTGAVIDVVNNLNFNWGKRGITYSVGRKNYSGPSFANLVNNVFKAGAGHNGKGSGVPIMTMAGKNPWAGSKIYLKGNVSHLGAPMDKLCGSLPNDALRSANPVGPQGVNRPPFNVAVRPTAGLADQILSRVGRTKPARDATDLRIVDDVRKGVSRRPNSPADVGGYPLLHSGEPYPDLDRDGMDDRWEIANSLDPRDCADRNRADSQSGYTNLEVFLDEMTGD